MRTAKYLFEFEKIVLNFRYIFMYRVSFCTISVVAQIGTGAISITSIVTQILRPSFEKFIFGNLVLVISKGFFSMSPNHSGCPSLPL